MGLFKNGIPIPFTGWRINLYRHFGLDTEPANTEDEFDPILALYGGSHQWQMLQKSFAYQERREKLYDFFDLMDETTLAFSLLDLVAEDASRPNPDTNKRIWVTSKSRRMVEAGDDMLHTLDMQEKVFPMLRELAKMGDDFERIVYSSGAGIQAIHWIDPRKVQRYDNRTARLAGFSQDGKTFRGKDGGKGKSRLSWPWDYVHFRIMGRFRRHPYGTSLLYGARRAWRQKVLAEDAALLYRLARAPDRNLFLVDVGSMDFAQAHATLQKWKRRVKKWEYVDPSSPNYDQQHQTLSPMDDVFMAKRKGSETSIEKLAGSPNVNDIEDVEYFGGKLLAALRVPRGYFGFLEAREPMNQKQTLSNQSVRFARTVGRLQHGYIMGVVRLLEIHYSLLGAQDLGNAYDFEIPGQEFDVHMEPPSYLAELERLELLRIRAEVAAAVQGLGEGKESYDEYEWVRYILREYARLDESTINRVTKRPPPPAPEGGEGAPEGGAAPGVAPEEGYDDQLKHAERILRANGDLSKSERERLAQVVVSNPSLMEAISQARRLFAPLTSSGRSGREKLAAYPRDKALRDQFDEDEEIQALIEGEGGEAPGSREKAGEAKR